MNAEWVLRQLQEVSYNELWFKHCGVTADVIQALARLQMSDADDDKESIAEVVLAHLEHAQELAAGLQKIRDEMLR